MYESVINAYVLESHHYWTD